MTGWSSLRCQWYEWKNSVPQSGVGWRNEKYRREGAVGCRTIQNRNVKESPAGGTSGTEGIAGRDALGGRAECVLEPLNLWAVIFQT